MERTGAHPVGETLEVLDRLERLVVQNLDIAELKGARRQGVGQRDGLRHGKGDAREAVQEPRAYDRRHIRERGAARPRQRLEERRKERRDRRAVRHGQRRGSGHEVDFIKGGLRARQNKL